MIELDFPKNIRITNSDNFFLDNDIKGINLEKKSEINLQGKFQLGENLTFSGKVSILEGAHIENGCILRDIEIGQGNHIRAYSILENSNFGKKNIIGPFCFVRDDSKIGNNCIIGNHVEIARSLIKNNVKISHQAFIGDMEINENSIIGANCVSCNYANGKRFLSIIGANTLIGAGSMLVSPLVIGNNVVIGAGSVVLKDIKNNAKFIQKRTNL